MAGLVMVFAAARRANFSRSWLQKQVLLMWLSATLTLLRPVMPSRPAHCYVMLSNRMNATSRIRRQRRGIPTWTSWYQDHCAFSNHYYALSHVCHSCTDFLTVRL